jgi:hypothetical protein
MHARGGGGVAKLHKIRVQHSPIGIGCSIAQLVARWPATRQARVQIPARHPREVFPAEHKQ